MIKRPSMHRVSGSSMDLTQNSFPCPPPPQWPGDVLLLPIVFISPLLMYLLFSQPLQGQGQHCWVPYGRQLEHTTNPTNIAVVRGEALQELTSFKEVQAKDHTSSCHVESSCSMARCKGDTSEQVTHCLAIPVLSSMAVKQGQEERTILGCTWWLHCSHVMLLSYTRKVFLHPSCTPQHLELKQLELGLSCCDAESTQYQHRNRHVAVQRPPTTQGRGDITHPDSFYCSWDSIITGREGCLFRVTSHHGEKPNEGK